MNKCYRIVWNVAKNMFVVTSELSQGDHRVRATVAGLVLSAIGLTANCVHASDYGPLSGETINLNDGDTVTSVDGTTGIKSLSSGGQGVQINGKATIHVTGDSGSIGVKLDNSASNNLGNGTQINVTDTGTAKSASTAGLYINNTSPDTNINAENISINTISKKDAYGINVHTKNATLNFGSNSNIITDSQNGNATGVYFYDDNNTLTMDGGLVNVISGATGKAIGIDTYWTSGTTLNLGDDTRIELVSGTAGGSALYLGENTLLNANGLNVDFTASEAGTGTIIYGIQTGQNSQINLGENSAISLSSSGGTVYGLLSGAQSHFTADSLDITLTTTSTERAKGTGADISGNVDFGNDSTITVHGFSEGYGMVVEDYSATTKDDAIGTVKANNLTIDVTGQKTEGLRIEGGVVDLGSDSSISANGTASTIYLTGRGYGEFNANNLTVTTAQSTALTLISSMHATVANIGEGSTIDGRNTTSHTTNGIVANTPHNAPTTINVNGSAEQRNTIYAVNGYGASAQYSGATINLSNTDIIMSGSNPYGLWAIGSGDFTHAGIINAENLTIDMSGANGSGYGVVVQQGGIVNLTGDTTIIANGGVAIWNPKVTSGGYVLPGGTVNGSGKMTITGDIINSGWGYINLSMDAGSYFAGATSVNESFNDQGIDSILNLNLADRSQWRVTDDSTLTTLTNAGTLELAADHTAGTYSTLHADEVTLKESSILSVDLSAAALASRSANPLITGGQVNPGGDLHVSNSGNTLDLNALTSDNQLADIDKVTLIDADSAIVSDFASISTDPDTLPDYIAISGQVNALDNTQYELGVGLSWYAGDSAAASTPAHGTFTLDAGQTFTVNRLLEDTSSNATTGWDGKSLTKKGDGTLTLTAKNTWSGTTDIQQGTLWLTESGVIGAEGSKQSVNVKAGATLGGNGVINGAVNNIGLLSFGDSTTPDSQFIVNGNVTNQGVIRSSSTTPGNALIINGDYTGNGGQLSLNASLGDDNSPTDQLIVSGNVNGSTTLYINNVDGVGAYTDQGIEIVDVGGVSSDNAFYLGNQIQIGLYEYRLYEDNESWYLRSKAETPDNPDDDVTPVDPDDGGSDVTPVDPDDGGSDVTPVDPDDDGSDVTPVDPDDGGSDVTPVDPDDGGSDVTPVDPDDGGSDVTPVDPDDGGRDVTPVDPDDGGSDVTPVDPDDGSSDVTPSNPQYRADIGAYLGNQWLARSLQMQTLFDREGSQYRSAEGSVWARMKGGKTDTSAVNGNIGMDSDYTQFQLGSDIVTWRDDQQSITFGLMASYLDGSTDSTGNRGADGSQFTATGDIDGYNLGAYATWFSDARQHRGWYVDTWYQYGFYNNSVENGNVGSTHYDSLAHAISLESGYRYDINMSSANTVSLTPQAQVIWQRYQADSVETNGTHIDGQNGDSWTTRLGLRIDSQLSFDDATVRPFAEINWLHTSDNLAVSFDNATVKQDLPADRSELKVGIQANLNSQWSISAQAAGQIGNNDYQDLNGSLNLRYSW
ncbi:autotransporter outer membrane beta-barrel domain-containing protein [Citrobacter portucalensis]|uniref:autotransporter outer membrane beta-barrel domain-containing protein n=1 Tax=Citrobacter portucalensis TaxID=1639133 RepID=UPI0011EBADB3|nr:autotransporter outer membrane beta-barrel domain-containing protein [Citrobacter portucalensis]KAA0569259.1 autotransporter outer membrane beta-barrel domain-containing protein [Citrobacter portucalensis]MEB0980238.1 autotransporter outer membrane beta-barrel domain-containing protein [Citrobacter portucalensis]